MNSDVLLKREYAALAELADVFEEFEEKYLGAVEACRKTGLPVVTFTIYNGNFPDPEYRRLASTALTVFNDVILRGRVVHTPGSSPQDG